MPDAVGRLNEGQSILRSCLARETHPSTFVINGCALACAVVGTVVCPADCSRYLTPEEDNVGAIISNQCHGVDIRLTRPFGEGSMRSVSLVGCRLTRTAS